MNSKLKVFYDGGCHLCSREIDVYRAKDTQKKLDLIDISQPHFDALQEGLDPEEVMKSFHAKRPNGEILSGVEAFVAIWDEIKIFSGLALLAKNPVSRKVMDLGYFGFSKLRPYLPRRKNCEDGNCRI